MSLRTALIATLFLAIPAQADNAALPPGAALRLGEARFRAGGPVSDLTFSDDGRELTSRVPVGDRTTRVSVWDTETGIALRTTVEPRRAARARWSSTVIPDSTRGIVIDEKGVAVVRDFAAKRDLVRLIGHFAPVSAAAVSSDGKRIATASTDGLIRVWDAATFRPLVEAKGHTATVRRVDVSPDGRVVLTTGMDRTVRLWDLATGRELRAFATSGERDAAFAMNGAAVAIPADNRIVIRDLVTGLEVLSPVSRRSDPLAAPMQLLRRCGLSLALSPDGRALALGRSCGIIELYETATGQLRRRLAGPGPACCDVTFTPDGSKLLTAGADHSVLVWPVRLRDVALSPEWKRETNASRLWDRMTLGDAATAYLAMARLAADPVAVVKMARLRLAPGETSTVIGDARSIELLEAVRTAESRAILRELAGDESEPARSRGAQAALARLGDPVSPRDGVRTVGGTGVVPGERP
jgi:WD40 repeat protein